MSKFQKAKERILSVPFDYSYTEVKYLLGKMGFKEYNKGRTSGSWVKFYRVSDNNVIMIHKPHPEDIMDRGAVEDLVKKLVKMGEL